MAALTPLPKWTFPNTTAAVSRRLLPKRTLQRGLLSGTPQLAIAGEAFQSSPASFRVRLHREAKALKLNVQSMIVRGADLDPPQAFELGVVFQGSAHDDPSASA